MPKRQCKFLDRYTTEWSFIKRGKNDYEAHCMVCGSDICIGNGGKASIQDHIKSAKHSSKLSIASQSKEICSFMIKKNTKLERLIHVAELTSAFRIINHHQSFNCMDCSTKLDSLLYPDSEIASKQSNARTKATALVRNVLAPHSVAEFISVLRYVPFYGISTDSSNHKAEKIFPLLIHYFTETHGLNIRLLKISSLPNETSDTIAGFCVDSLKSAGIPLENLTAFGADNTNTNFGGRQRHGVNNIFYKLKGVLGRDIEGIGCSAHILHNTLSSAADVLSIDVESVVLKIFKYFCIYTVRTERLKEFCENAKITFNTILSHTRIRWLSLLPAIERILQLWKPLKEFFEVEKGAPKLITDFFSNPLAEIYFTFVHSQAFVIEKQIKKIEKRNITVMEVQLIVNDTLRDLKERFKNNFIGMQTQIALNVLKKSALDENQIPAFEKDTKNFFTTAIAYLEDWLSPLTRYEIFNWMTLHNIPEWTDVQKTITFLHEKNVFMSDECFEEVLYLISILYKNREALKTKDTLEKWLYFFEKTSEQERKKNLLMMVQYLYAMPSHNAHVERVFSLISAQWTKERNSLKTETLESIIQCKFNFNMTCCEFYNYIKDEDEVLQKVQSSQKY